MKSYYVECSVKYTDPEDGNDQVDEANQSGDAGRLPGDNRIIQTIRLCYQYKK
jgi:hypothetical protein